MATKLAVAGCKNLYEFWKEQLTDTLNSRLEAQGSSSLVNLASEEYAKVIDKSQLSAQMISVVFKQPHKSGFRTIPIHAKRARGLMIHYAISHRLAHALDLQAFDLGGYSFIPEESSPCRWIFTSCAV
jgi:cytoplasmic iron level regulating protein YaaA (DUF328/UPF0246 family)